MLDKLTVDRVGHGYNAVYDESVLRRIRENGIHLECCPTSSMVTKAHVGAWKEHPIVRFAEEGISFSLNTDDASLFQIDLNSELVLAHTKLELSFDTICKTVVDAAKASFLENDEKQALVLKLQDHIAHARTRLGLV